MQIKDLIIQILAVMFLGTTVVGLAYALSGGHMHKGQRYADITILTDPPIQYIKKAGDYREHKLSTGISVREGGTWILYNKDYKIREYTKW